MAEQKVPFYKQKWFWIVVVAVIILGIGFGATRKDGGNNSSDTSQSKEEQKQENSDPVYFDELEMETFCQEDHVNDINGWIESSGRDISMIYTTNYNKYFEPKYSKTTDGAERPVALLSWNGKDKDTNQPVSFMCWATKIDGEKKLLLLEIDMNIVRGQLSNIYGEEE